jgi:hypothetical protein
VADTQDQNADGGTMYTGGSTTMTEERPAPARARFAAPPGSLVRPSDDAVAPQAPAQPTIPAQPSIAVDNSEVIGAANARPRASLLASLSLIFGVLAAVGVATGQLAGPGIGLGVITALLAFGGIAATSSPRVAGKGDALVGMLLGLGAVVVGVLSVTGTITWLTPDTNLLANLHHWLQIHASWMLPS